MNKYEVYAIRNYDEYLEGTFNTMKEAKEHAQALWEHLSTHDKKRQRIEVRFNFTEFGWDAEVVE